MGNECCENCKYFHNLKYGFQPFHGFIESKCCIALTRECEEPDSIDAFVIETTADDLCEMFCERSGKNG